MNLNDFTIIIPCISFQDVKKCIQNIRKIIDQLKLLLV